MNSYYLTERPIKHWSWIWWQQLLHASLSALCKIKENVHLLLSTQTRLRKPEAQQVMADVLCGMEQTQLSKWEQAIISYDVLANTGTLKRDLFALLKLSPLIFRNTINTQNVPAAASEQLAVVGQNLSSLTLMTAAPISPTSHVRLWPGEPDGVLWRYIIMLPGLNVIS